MSLGPVMLDLVGPEIDAEEQEMLLHPAVGGVILFARNFHSPGQLTALCAAIHALRDPRLLVAVDQEGGRVQRFRDGFTRLPPAARFGALSRVHRQAGRRAATAVGWLMAAELRAVGVDFSFAPVLDVDRRVSRIIADRAFSDRPQEVSDLASAWVRGVHDAGMAAVGKHFPGHGAVVGDSHDELPIDERRFGEIETEDLLPFARLIGSGLEAVMPAHLVYSSVDPNPAGFSAFWLRHILRERLDFQGIVFSDDLNMAAAAVGGGYAERARRALDAGCDLLLVCNNRAAAVETIESLRDYDDPTMHVRCLRLHGRGHFEWSRLHLEPRWQQGVQAVAELEALDQPSLDL